ncbi:MAG: exonuclease SbcCD subunit D [Clostridiales bacterium]|nr:exonuclease SbcCD subunit D [Clostridiales bacterium]
MKLFHISDLHLGKRLNEHSLLEDQRYILSQITAAIDAEKPDALLIAGDIYDKAIPPVEAVSLFDDFLYGLTQRSLPVLLISGNHDSAERVTFGSRLLARSGLYFAPVYQGTVEAVTLVDAHGPVDFYLMPFVKSSQVRHFHPEETIVSYTDAMVCAIRQMSLNPDHRSVLVTHQFVTGASLSDSEEISVGGSENVDASVFAAFDYVALGHIHGPQNIGDQRIRYCGSPLKYSFSEANHQKSITVVQMEQKGQLTVSSLPLIPMRELRKLKGSFEMLTSPAFYQTQDRDAYLQITLTDEELIPNAMQTLRLIYPNLLNLLFDNRRTASNQIIDADDRAEEREPEEYFAELYQLQNNQPMTEEQYQYIRHLVTQIREGEA